MIADPLGLSLGEPLQLGFIVADAQRAVEQFTELLGLGPWSFEDWPPQRPGFESYADGEPRQWRTRLAFASFGPLELELIEPVEGDTDYSRFLAEWGGGFHHVLYVVDDLDAVEAALTARGFPVVMGATSRFPGARWILVDTRETLGFSLELRSRLPQGAGE